MVYAPDGSLEDYTHIPLVMKDKQGPKVGIHRPNNFKILGRSSEFNGYDGFKTNIPKELYRFGSLYFQTHIEPVEKR